MGHVCKKVFTTCPEVTHLFGVGRGHAAATDMDRVAAGRGRPEGHSGGASWCPGWWVGPAAVLGDPVRRRGGSLYPFPAEMPIPDRLRRCSSLGRVWYPLQRDPGNRSRCTARPGPSAVSESPLSGLNGHMRGMSRADCNHEGCLRGCNSARLAGPSVPLPVLG